jgi:hypothetical protein
VSATRHQPLQLEYQTDTVHISLRYIASNIASGSDNSKLPEWSSVRTHNVKGKACVLH